MTPPETIPPRCSITAKAPPPLPPNPTPAELRTSLLSRQKELQPQLDVLRASGCQQISIHYTPTGQ